MHLFVDETLKYNENQLQNDSKMSLTTTVRLFSNLFNLFFLAVVQKVGRQVLFLPFMCTEVSKRLIVSEIFLLAKYTTVSDFCRVKPQFELLNEKS
jgi:AraC-like DNA-binding protein